jgi:hypothetical protein
VVGSWRISGAASLAICSPKGRPTRIAGRACTCAAYRCEQPCRTHILTSFAPALHCVRACHFDLLHTHHVGGTTCCDFFLPFVSRTLPPRLVVVVAPTPCCTSHQSALAAPILDTPCSESSYKTLRHSPPTICRPSIPIRGHDHRCRQSPAPACGTSVGGRRGLVEDICTHCALDFLSPRRDAQLSRL